MPPMFVSLGAGCARKLGEYLDEGLRSAHRRRGIARSGARHVPLRSRFATSNRRPLQSLPTARCQPVLLESTVWLVRNRELNPTATHRRIQVMLSKVRTVIQAELAFASPRFSLRQRRARGSAANHLPWQVRPRCLKCPAPRPRYWMRATTASPSGMACVRGMCR